MSIYSGLYLSYATTMGNSQNAIVTYWILPSKGLQVTENTREFSIGEHLTCYLKMLQNGCSSVSWKHCLTSQPGLDVGCGCKGERSQKHKLLGLEVLYSPRHTAVLLDSSLPVPLQCWGLGGAVIVDSAVDGHHLSLCY